MIKNKKISQTDLLAESLISASDTISWQELFPEYTEEEIPDVVLAGSRIKEGMTQKQLSEITGIPQRHISEMENGKRGIGIKRAKILADALNVGYKVFPIII